MITGTIAIPKRERHTFGIQLGRWICLPPSTPTPFNELFRKSAAVSLLRLHIAPKGSNGILTVSAIAIAVRLRLRTRLTPGMIGIARETLVLRRRGILPLLSLLIPTFAFP